VEFFIGNNSAQEFSMNDFMETATEKVGKATMGQLLDAINPEVLMKADPEYSESFAEMAEQRKLDDGNMKGAGFRKVASFTNVPLIEALRIQEGLLKGKKEFYKLLEKYPQYRSYDKRGADHSRVTFVDGKSIAY
jgi:hypothetical protein